MKAFIIDLKTKKVYEQTDLIFGGSNEVFRSILLSAASWYGENSEYVIPCSKMQTILFAAMQRAANNRCEEIGTVMRHTSEFIGNVNPFDAIKHMYDEGEVIAFAVNPSSALRIVERDLKGE